MSETTVADARERREALDIGRSFIVQAPAGSGKTELLTQRFLRLLASVEHPEEISAITFTRKAAAEMRNRVLKALDSATAPKPEEPHRRQTWSLARAALEQDARQDWQLIHNPNRLRIQTFDSLSHTLARQMPLLSELGAPPATTDSPEAHYREAARATLRMLEDPSLGPDVEALLVHLDNRRQQLEDLLCSMLARRDQWLVHAVSSPDADQINAALEDAVTDHLLRLHESCPPDWLHHLIAMATHAVGNLAVDTGGQVPAGLEDWHDRDTAPDPVWKELPAWLALAQLLLTKGGGLRKSWNADIGFPAPSEKGISAETRAQRTTAKQAMKELCLQLGERPAAVALWAGLRLLPHSGLDPQQRSVLTSLFRVLVHATAELRLVFQDSGEVDFAEIQMRARRALGTPEDPTDLALALDYRLRHLLVDEFQDTSSSQFQLLETLTAGWQDGDGRTLFAVGDPMQSIYRFREAEVGLYLAARDRGIGDLRLQALTLSVNFRSTRGIVDWVNRGFREIFPDRGDPGRGAVSYSPARAFDDSDDPAAVRVHPFAGLDAQAEADTVTALVQQALTETETGLIAVLARARSHLRDIALALGGADIPFQAVDIDPLAQRPAVRDLHALTRALLHPADRLSWLVVLRAPWLGLGMQDLLLITERSPGCVLARLRDRDLVRTLSEDGRRRVERLLRIIDGQLPARGRRPLRQWVETIWLNLGGAATAGARGTSDAEAYLALLDRHEQHAGLLDFTRLEDALQKLYASPEGGVEVRVRLMTIHKSKGLEFDTVILPGLGRRPASDGGALMYWLERTGSDGHPQLLMAPIRAARQDDEAISNYLRELNRDKDRLETARLLYVAATRARRRLMLLGHLGFNARGIAARPPGGSLLERLWPVVEKDFAQLVAPNETGTTETTTLLRQLDRLPADWRPGLVQPLTGQTPQVKPAVFSPRIEFAWAGDTARHIGTLVHRHLERFAREGISDWSQQRLSELGPALRLGLQNLGVAAAELDRATGKTLQALQRTLADERGRWILADHAKARCEWALTLHDEETRHYVIDRTFVDQEGVRWIIDYKTGEHLDADRETFLDQEQERYREQLENYGRILRLMEDRPIRLALYFPLFPDWRSWDYADG